MTEGFPLYPALFPPCRCPRCRPGEEREPRSPNRPLPGETGEEIGKTEEDE